MSLPVFLLSDFGTEDVYAGTMRAVIQSIYPGCIVHDLTHGIPKFKVKAAAYRLYCAFSYLPERCVIIAVVDPGVGSNRRAIAIQFGERILLCPDNGIATILFSKHPFFNCFVLDKPQYFLERVSNTFHGRDIFAPVAAQLAKGADLRLVGTLEGQGNLNRIDLPRAKEFTDGSWELDVIDIDSYGNLVSSYEVDEAERSASNSWRVSIDSHQILSLTRTYSDLSHGQPIAYIGSCGFIEIGVREGNARQLFGSSPSIKLYK